MDTTTETHELRRLPGLYRRWELGQLLKAGEDYHIEDAGRTLDGTELVAVYESVAAAEVRS